MAKLFPDIKTIKDSIERLQDKRGKEGELKLIEFLAKLSDEYEVYFQPFINGDLPDIVLMKKGFGSLWVVSQEISNSSILRWQLLMLVLLRLALQLP